MVGAIELQPLAGKPTARAFDAFLQAYDKGLLIRTTGDIIALSPPLIVEKSHIDFIIDPVGDVLKTAHVGAASRRGGTSWAFPPGRPHCRPSAAPVEGRAQGGRGGKAERRGGTRESA